jgi:hypothetical protein
MFNPPPRQACRDWVTTQDQLRAAAVATTLSACFERREVPAILHNDMSVPPQMHRVCGPEQDRVGDDAEFTGEPGDLFRLCTVRRRDVLPTSEAIPQSIQ